MTFVVATTRKEIPGEGWDDDKEGWDDDREGWEDDKREGWDDDREGWDDDKERVGRCRLCFRNSHSLAYKQCPNCYRSNGGTNYQGR
jgi:hypothetical protein